MEKVRSYLKRLNKLLTKQELSILPGQLAYFFVLSTVPIISLLFFAANFFGLDFNLINNFLKESFSEEVISVIQPIIKVKTQVDLKFIIFLVIALVIASGGAYSIIIASNTVFKTNELGVIKRRVKSFILTIILIILFLFILVVPLFGEPILKFLAYFGIENQIIKGFNIILPILKWPVTAFVIFFFIKIVYTIAPDKNIPSSYVNKGAIFTTIIWMLATSTYSYYVTNFAQYDLFYGGLSNIVVLMLWFYLMSYIFVIGLAMNFRNMEEQLEKTQQLELKIKENKRKIKS